MIQDIVNGMSIKLNVLFGDHTKVYTDTVKQGLTEPCFLIQLLSPSLGALVGNRYHLTVPADILYFPFVYGDNDEMNSVAETLMENMDVLTLVDGDNIRGWGLRYEVIEEVLHFFVTYHAFVSKEQVTDLMTTISLLQRGND